MDTYPQPPAISAMLDIVSNARLEFCFGDLSDKNIPVDASDEDAQIRGHHGRAEHSELSITPDRERCG